MYYALQKKRGRAVLLACMLVSAVYPLRAEPEWAKMGTCLLGVGAVAAGVGGLIKFAGWAFTPSDEQLIARVEKHVWDWSSTYTDMINMLVQTYNVTDFNSYEQVAVFDDSSEELLKSYAEIIWKKNYTESNFRSELRTIVNDLRSDRNQLKSRVRYFEDADNISYKQYHILKDMKTTYDRLEYLFSRVNFLSKYLEHHSRYFELTEASWIAYDKYREELDYSYLSHATTGQMHDKIERIIRLQHSKDRYPHIVYVQELDNHLTLIYAAMEAVGYSYQSRVQEVKQTVGHLENIRNALDTVYRYELEQRRLDRLEERRIKALEDQVCVERQKAHELRRNNRLKVEELEARRRESEKLHQEGHRAVDFSVYW